MSPSPEAAPAEAVTAPGHSRLDDALAWGTGTLLFALSIAVVQAAGLLTGGTSGLALLGHYLTGISFGRVLFALNLPFYVLAVRTLGGRFTARTLLVVALVSGFSELMPRLVRFERLDPVFAAVAGGLLAGVSLIILFRHGASLGGIGVLALHLHDRFGWRVGWVQLVLDAAILLAALAFAPPARVALSIVGMLAFNVTIALNHRPGRYAVAIA